MWEPMHAFPEMGFGHPSLLALALGSHAGVFRHQSLFGGFQVLDGTDTHEPIMDHLVLIWILWYILFIFNF